MINRPEFDTNFIDEWESKYYTCEKGERDEKSYQLISKDVQSDITNDQNIRSATLHKILKWKDKRERIHKHVEWDKYDILYAPRFRLVLRNSIADHHKCRILIWNAEDLCRKLPVKDKILDDIQGKAHGFGVPVASTVLHFMFPQIFPIMDIRTAETLYFADRMPSVDRENCTAYDRFCNVIKVIARNTGYTLHQIDRALFAYHETILQTEMNNTYRSLASTITKNDELTLPLEAPKKLRKLIIDQIKLDP